MAFTVSRNLLHKKQDGGDCEIHVCSNADAYVKPCRTSAIELFAKIVNG